MNDLMIVLPAEAVQIEKDIEALPVLEVIDDRTNIAASENLKIVSKFLKDFRDACEPKRMELRTPLDNFLALKKAAEDKIESWIFQQKQTIGQYSQEIIRKENERRRIEQDRINAERKAELDHLNEQRRIEAEKAGTEAKVEEFVPVQEPVMMEKARVKSEFVISSVKEKPEAVIVDLVQFFQGMIDTGNFAYLKMIFPKWNESKLNEFCKASGINGRDVKFPGLSVEMIPEVRVR